MIWVTLRERVISEQRLGGGEAIGHAGLSRENSRQRERRMQRPASKSVPGIFKASQGSQGGQSQVNKGTE